VLFVVWVHVCCRGDASLCRDLSSTNGVFAEAFTAPLLSQVTLCSLFRHQTRLKEPRLHSAIGLPARRWVLKWQLKSGNTDDNNTTHIQHVPYLQKRFCYFGALISVKKQLNDNLCNGWHAFRTPLQVFLDINQNTAHSLCSITPTYRNSKRHGYTLTIIYMDIFL